MIVAKTLAILKKDTLTAVRYRNGFVFAGVGTAAQLATFYYMARAVGPQFRPEGMSYFLFLLVGTGFYTFLMAGIHSFLRTIQESQQSGTLEVLMTTSTPPTVLLVLSTLSAFAGGIVQLLLSLSAGLWLSSPLPHIDVLGCAAIFFLSILICTALGLFAAGVQIWIHKGSAVLWLLGSGAWLMAGALFPVAALPHAVRVLSALLPLTHSLNGMRIALLQSSNAAGLISEAKILTLFCVFLIPLSIMFFSWTVRRARQFGTLSFY